MVTGANGQLGKELKAIAPRFPEFEFIFLSREDMPIHHFELVRNTMRIYKPDYLINCAAYTAVDRAETEPDLAFLVNGEAVGVLAQVCQETACRFIHISTDYVFDGTGTQPYREEDAIHPQNVYGASKLEGEKRAIAADPDVVIIRTSWVYSPFGKNFVKTMIRLMEEKPEISVVNDQVGSPTYAHDLAIAILQIIRFARWTPGIYHYSNDGAISWYEFAVEIGKQLNSQCRIHAIPTSQFPTPARRPAYSVLDKTRISQTYGIRPLPWKKSLQDCLTAIRG